MKNYFKGFALALSMLSIIPFFKVHHFNRGINGYSVMFYPLVGFLLGLILFFTHSLLSPYLASTHLSIIIFTLWIVLSGALHLDGFSDTLDGLFVKKEKALEVMKDSHVGGMGMIFTLSFLILKASSLVHFQAFYLLPAILMFSRFNAVLAIYTFAYITKDGMGALAKKEFTSKQLCVSFLYVLVFSYFNFTLLFVALLTLFVIKSFFIKRYGGFSGDIYGFLIEVSELVLLNTILLGIAI